MEVRGVEGWVLLLRTSKSPTVEVMWLTGNCGNLDREEGEVSIRDTEYRR